MSGQAFERVSHEEVTRWGRRVVLALVLAVVFGFGAGWGASMVWSAHVVVQ